MSKFTTALTATQLDADEWYLWQLNTTLTYIPGAVEELSDGNVVSTEGRTPITVYKGFITDGASVPRMLWWLLPTWGRYGRAAVVHDYLTDLIVKGSFHPEAKTRRAADAIFYEAMRVSGCSLVMAWSMWLAVRLHSVLGGE